MKGYKCLEEWRGGKRGEVERLRECRGGSEGKPGGNGGAEIPRELKKRVLTVGALVCFMMDFPDRYHQRRRRHYPC